MLITYTSESETTYIYHCPVMFCTQSLNLLTKVLCYLATYIQQKRFYRASHVSASVVAFLASIEYQ